MRKLAMAAGLVALVVATPALADGHGGSSSANRFHNASDRGGSFNRVYWGLWKIGLSPQPDFSSHGRHFGWFHGRHWGWFRPHNPHWPHEHPASP